MTTPQQGQPDQGGQVVPGPWADGQPSGNGQAPPPRWDMVADLRRGEAGTWKHLVCWKDGQIDLAATRANFPVSDQDTAEFLARERPGWLHYADDSGTWYRWNKGTNPDGSIRPGTHHKPVTSGVLRRSVVASYAARAEQALAEARRLVELAAIARMPQATEAELAKAVATAWAEWKPAVSYAAGLKQDRGQKALLSTLASICSVPDSDMADRHPRLLNTSSGTVNLQEGWWRPADPADMITYCVPAACHPELDYPPMFAQLLYRMCGGDGEVAHYVWKALGYALLGENPEQKIFFLSGPTKSGKTQLLYIVNQVLGSIAHESKAELITYVRQGRNARTENSIRGKRLITITETSRFMHIDEGQIKRITGEPVISVDRHYDKVALRTVVTWTIFVATNDMPSITNMDGAIQERVEVIPCGKTIPESQRDKRLAEKILGAERDAILTWLIRGCMCYHAEGLNPPKAVTEANARYRSQQSSAANFATDYCDLVPEGATGSIEKAEAWPLYVAWCRDRKRGQVHAQIDLEKQEFFEHMASLPGVVEHDNGGSIRRFYGLVWNEVARLRMRGL